eukprot:1157370-Pelagomonas_calceolata.AAC.1
MAYAKHMHTHNIHLTHRASSVLACSSWCTPPAPIPATPRQATRATSSPRTASVTRAMQRLSALRRWRKQQASREAVAQNRLCMLHRSPVMHQE